MKTKQIEYGAKSLVSGWWEIELDGQPTRAAS